MMECYRLSVTTTGGDGSATGNSTTEAIVRGKLHAVYLDYHASAPNTTDVTVAIVEAQAVTLLTVSNNATDGWYLPRGQVCSTAAAGLTYDGTYTVCEPFPVTGGLKVSVAGCNALTGAVVAYLYVES
jgi:hypothetical protein